MTKMTTSNFPAVELRMWFPQVILKFLEKIGLQSRYETHFHPQSSSDGGDNPAQSLAQLTSEEKEWWALMMKPAPLRFLNLCRTQGRLLPRKGPWLWGKTEQFGTIRTWTQTRTRRTPLWVLTLETVLSSRRMSGDWLKRGVDSEETKIAPAAETIWRRRPGSLEVLFRRWLGDWMQVRRRGRQTGGWSLF